jgi:hypothetical protein
VDLQRLSVARHKAPVALMSFTVMALVGLIASSGAGAAPIAVPTTLPVETSSGETQPPPGSTELPECSAVNEEAPALGAMDDPRSQRSKAGARSTATPCQASLPTNT